MPIAMTQEQQALQASLRDWAKRAGPIAVIRARQDVTALMNDLAALGVFAIPQDGTVTRCLSIAGGTTQILLTQVAERILGLPR